MYVYLFLLEGWRGEAGGGADEWDGMSCHGHVTCADLVMVVGEMGLQREVAGRYYCRVVIAGGMRGRLRRTNKSVWWRCWDCTYCRVKDEGAGAVGNYGMKLADQDLALFRFSLSPFDILPKLLQCLAIPPSQHLSLIPLPQFQTHPHDLPRPVDHICLPDFLPKPPSLTMTN